MTQYVPCAERRGLTSPASGVTFVEGLFNQGAVPYSESLRLQCAMHFCHLNLDCLRTIALSSGASEFNEISSRLSYE